MRKRQQLTNDSTRLSSGQRRLVFSHFLILMLLVLIAFTESGSGGERRRTRRNANQNSVAAQVEPQPRSAANPYDEPEKFYHENRASNFRDYDPYANGVNATLYGTAEHRAPPPPRLPDLDLEVPIIDYSLDPHSPESAEEPVEAFAELLADLSSEQRQVQGNAGARFESEFESEMENQTTGSGNDRTPNPGSAADHDADSNADPHAGPDSEQTAALDSEEIGDSGRKVLGYLDGEVIEDIQVPATKPPPLPSPGLPATGLEIADSDLDYGEWKDYQPRVYIEPINNEGNIQVIEARKTLKRGILPRTRYLKPVTSEDVNNCDNNYKRNNIRHKDIRYTDKQQAVPFNDNYMVNVIPDYPTPSAASAPQYATSPLIEGYTLPDPIATYYPTPDVAAPAASHPPAATLPPSAESCPIPPKPEVANKRESTPSEPVASTRSNGIVKRTTPVLPKVEVKQEPAPIANPIQQPQLKEEPKKQIPTIKPKVRVEPLPDSGLETAKPKLQDKPESDQRVQTPLQRYEEPKAKPESRAPAPQLPLVAASPQSGPTAAETTAGALSAAAPGAAAIEDDTGEFQDKYYTTNSRENAENDYIMQPLHFPGKDYKECPETPSSAIPLPVVLPKLALQTPQLGPGGNIPPPQTSTPRKNTNEVAKAPSSDNKSQNNSAVRDNIEQKIPQNAKEIALPNQQKTEKVPSPPPAAKAAAPSGEVAKGGMSDNSRLDKESAPASLETATPPLPPPVRPESLANREPWRQSAPPPTRAEIEAYRSKLEQRLLERYNNLPDHAGQVAKVTVVLSKPVDISLDGTLMRAEFDQLVYDPWGKRITELEQEYFAVTFGAGGPRQVRSEPSIRIGLDKETVYSEHAPLPADPFKAAPGEAAFHSNPKVKMPNWWRPEFRD